MMPKFDKPLVCYTLIDALNAVWYLCVTYAVWVLAFTLVSNYFGIGLDATDKDTWHRSGVSVVTDHQTGQQYLKTPEGFLTPRLGVK